MLNQYENLANPGAHLGSTGPEIWSQTGGAITHFVAGLGTCGTITGNGRYLKSMNPDVQIIAVHPEEGHDIPGVRSIKQRRLGILEKRLDRFKKANENLAIIGAIADWVTVMSRRSPVIPRAAPAPSTSADAQLAKNNNWAKSR